MQAVALCAVAARCLVLQPCVASLITAEMKVKMCSGVQGIKAAIDYACETFLYHQRQRQRHTFTNPVV